MNPKVDEFLTSATRWRAELEALRSILLDCGLREDFKWRQPCYTSDGGNIAIIGELKDCCTLSFFKGALLNDPHGMLAKPGENSRAARVIRFTSAGEIEQQQEAIKFFVEQAIEAEKAGLKVDFEQDRDLDIPEEFQAALTSDPALQTAFDGLTPGRQRGYLLHFSGAKTSQGRRSRVEKYTERILAGKGIHDCVCGHSARFPRCDGSHKAFE